MKRALSLLLLAAMALSLCACGQRREETAAVNTVPAAEAPQASPSADQELIPAESSLPETEAAPAEAVSSVVYFTSDISPEGLQAVYEALNWQPSGKLAVKVSTGEPPASNYSVAWNDDDWTMDAIREHYLTLVRYLNLRDMGMVLGTGCGTPSQTRRSRYPQAAYELGKKLR